MAKPIELTDANFAAETAQGLTLVDFWAEWCHPCRQVAPVIEGLAEQYAGQVKIAKLNTEEQPATAMRFRVMSIPTVMLFKDGQPVEVTVGADMSGRRYRAQIDKHLEPVKASAPTA